jgi:hypothetical protein
LEFSQQSKEGRIRVEKNQREWNFDVTGTGTEPAKAGIDKLSHLVNLEYVLLCDLLANVVVLAVLFQKASLCPL